MSNSTVTEGTPTQSTTSHVNIWTLSESSIMARRHDIMNFDLYQINCNTPNHNFKESKSTTFSYDIQRCCSINLFVFLFQVKNQKGGLKFSVPSILIFKMWINLSLKGFITGHIALKLSSWGQTTERKMLVPSALLECAETNC